MNKKSYKETCGVVRFFVNLQNLSAQKHTTYDCFYNRRKLYSNTNKLESTLFQFINFIRNSFSTSLDEKIFIKKFATIFQRRTHWISLLKLSLFF